MNGEVSKVLKSSNDSDFDILDHPFPYSNTVSVRMLMLENFLGPDWTCISATNAIYAKSINMEAWFKNWETSYWENDSALDDTMILLLVLSLSTSI